MGELSERELTMTALEKRAKKITTEPLDTKVVTELLVSKPATDTQPLTNIIAITELESEVTADSTEPDPKQFKRIYEKEFAEGDTPQEFAKKLGLQRKNRFKKEGLYSTVNTPDEKLYYIANTPDGEREVRPCEINGSIGIYYRRLKDQKIIATVVPDTSVIYHIKNEQGKRIFPDSITPTNTNSQNKLK
jgi:hypothetical protein